ncbi:MAG: hypothetical protein DMF31_13460 [Verrucomicrobia bacterium]|nr:MAG: hypothetical protein DMF31_13460 [Verrucomicrobiota bacterium]
MTLEKIAVLTGAVCSWQLLSSTWAILKTRSVAIVAPDVRAIPVKRIGEALMTSYVWPLQCVGLLLTAALIGALVLVMEEKR